MWNTFRFLYEKYYSNWVYDEKSKEYYEIAFFASQGNAFPISSNQFSSPQSEKHLKSQLKINESKTHDSFIQSVLKSDKVKSVRSSYLN